MILFQIFALSIAVPLALLNLYRLLTRPTRKLGALTWFLFWILAAGALIWPDSTTQVAHKIGIQRGADMVSYSFVLIGSCVFYLVSFHLRRLSRQLTLVVRQLALTEAKLEELSQNADTSKSDSH